MRKITLYPMWIRLWHFINACLFLLLLTTGVGNHFDLLQSATTLPVHIFSGFALIFSYIFFFIMNIAAGNISPYFKVHQNCIHQYIKEAKYYLWNIFVKGRRMTYNPNVTKFGVIKQVLFEKAMYLLVPISILTGLLLYAPDLLPNQIFGASSLLLTSFLHTLSGYFLSIFLLFHIYLATTGKRPEEFLITITKGWIMYEDENDNETAALPSQKVGKTDSLLPTSFYNPLTMLGSILSLISFLMIITMVGIDLVVGSTSPYLGIITFVVLPSVMGLGLVLIFLGAIWENKKRYSAKMRASLMPIIDCNKPKTQKVFV